MGTFRGEGRVLRVIFGLWLQFWGLFSGEELEESCQPLLVVEFVAAG